MPILRSVLLTLIAFGGGAAGLAASELTMRARANVRFGPSTDAPIVVTLDRGATVQLIGQAPGREGWYQIRFPREGHAWMHEVVLEPTDDPRTLRVTEDRASVRADARIKGELVDQLTIGETVEWVGFENEGEWRGRKVGGWYAVYPPNAVAYVHHSVIERGGAASPAVGGDERAPAIAERPAQPTAASGEIERLWQSARATYRAHKEQLERDPESAIDIDWHSLARDLARVVNEHPEFDTRLRANRMYAGIQHLMAVVQRARQQRGLPAVASLPDVPAPRRDPAPPREPVRQTVPRPVTPPADPTPEPAPVRADPEPAPAPATPASPVQAPTPPLAQSEVELPDAAAPDDVGWLVQKDVIGSPASHVLIDENSEPAAVILEDRDSGIQLSEFFWRRVAVTGPSVAAEVTIDGLTQTLPVITAQDVRLVR